MVTELERRTWVVITYPTNGYSAGKHFPWSFSRDPYTVETPPEAIGIQFYDTLDGVAEVEGKEIFVESKMFNPSPFYWIKGKMSHIRDLEDERPDVARRMETRGYNRCVKIGSYYFPLEHNQELLKDYISRTNNGRKPEPTKSDRATDDGNSGTTDQTSERIGTSEESS